METFYWPDMTTDGVDFPMGCANCSRNKRLKRKNRADIQAFRAEAPVEKVHLDHLGPLPLTQQGNKYILVVMDQFIKWVEVAPLSDQMAETVVMSAVDFEFVCMGCLWRPAPTRAPTSLARCSQDCVSCWR